MRSECEKLVNDHVGRWCDWTGWDLVPVMEHGELIGVVGMNGSEIHVVMKRSPSSIGVARDAIRKTLKTIKNPVTSVMKSNDAGLEFCRRLGFRVTGENEHLYRMSA